MNAPHRALSSLLILTITAATAACTTSDPEPTPTPTQPPTVMADPTITWIDDIAPSSPLETDPAVQAARNGTLGTAMAFNTGDFTITQLTNNVSPRVIDYLADAYIESQGSSLYLGPPPWEPLQVEHNGNDAVVTVCQVPLVSSLGRVPDPAGIAGPYDRSEAHTEKIYLQEIGNRLMIVKYDSWHSTSCDGQSVPVGLFDPTPVASKEPVTEPVRPPEGWTPGKPRE